MKNWIYIFLIDLDLVWLLEFVEIEALEYSLPNLIFSFLSLIILFKLHIFLY